MVVVGGARASEPSALGQLALALPPRQARRPNKRVKLVFAPPCVRRVDVNTYSKSKYGTVIGQVGSWAWLQVIPGACCITRVLSMLWRSGRRRLLQAGLWLQASLSAP